MLDSLFLKFSLSRSWRRTIGGPSGWVRNTELYYKVQSVYCRKKSLYLKLKLWKNLFPNRDTSYGKLVIENLFIFTDQLRIHI